MNIRTNMKLSIGSFMALAMGLLGVLSSNQAQAQAKIGTNPGTINDRSVLELESNNQALYLPRLTTQELGNVSGWQEGMVVYNTTVACIQVFDGSNWECVGSDLNGIYSGSGSLSGATTVTMAGNDLNFTSTGGEVSIASTFNNHLDIGGTNNAGGIRIDRGTDGLKTGYIGYAEADNGDTMIVSNATGGGTLFLTGTGRTIIGTATTYPTTTATGAVTQFVVNHSNGQVGIGVAAPESRLHLRGSNATGAANGGYLTIEANAAVNLEFLTSGGGQDQSILYNVAGTQQASIDYDVSEDNLLFTGFNRIGLGTITPNATLDVNGSVAHNITTSTTIGADAHFVILAGGAVTLPTGTTQTGRVLTFINTHATNAITFTTAPTGSITQVNAGMSASAIYDGTTWYWYSIN